MVFVDMVEDYEAPCYDAIGNDASYKEMPNVVCTERRRSATPNQWSNDKVRVSVIHLGVAPIALPIHSPVCN